MKLLKIVNCTDPQMWYANDVGRLCPFLGTMAPDGWKTRDKEGYINVIRFKDAVLVEKR